MINIPHDPYLIYPSRILESVAGLHLENIMRLIELKETGYI